MYQEQEQEQELAAQRCFVNRNWNTIAATPATIDCAHKSAVIQRTKEREEINMEARSNDEQLDMGQESEQDAQVIQEPLMSRAVVRRTM